MQQETPLTITATELDARLREPNPPVVIDVRTATERQDACLSFTVHVPLSELAARASTLDRDAEIVVHCHRGMRSMQAVQYLRANGFARARNLTGGIEAWSKEVGRTR